MRKFTAIAAVVLLLCLAMPTVALADDARPDNDLDMNVVTRKSKKVVVRSLWPFQDGDVLKVKMGKRKYSKRVSRGTKAVVKIRKPKTWQKVTATLYDASGQKVGKSCKDRVYYSNGIEIGMTKKQVKRAYGFGKPDFATTLKGGYRAWFYWTEDGDSFCVVYDRKGRVGSFG